MIHVKNGDRAEAWKCQKWWCCIEGHVIHMLEMARHVSDKPCCGVLILIILFGHLKDTGRCRHPNLDHL